MANVRYTNLPNKDLARTENVSAEYKTKTFFNGYFDQAVSITGPEWDIVFSFFKKLTQDDQAAKSLSAALITTAEQKNANPIDLIKELDQYNSIELDQVLALYFNATRRGTSLLGYTQTRTPNKYVARNILA